VEEAAITQAKEKFTSSLRVSDVGAAANLGTFFSQPSEKNKDVVGTSGPACNL
jgi:hypothetical protein